MKRIAVVGPIPRDTITTYRGEVIEKYGCVTHPTIALALLLEGLGEVIPIAHVHGVDREPIHSLFQNYSNINLEGIYSDKNQGTIIDLRFIDQNNRIEKQMENMHPITAEDVAPFHNVDWFVFVPITDFEIELDTLRSIKENSEAKIIFDAHGPTTYVDLQGNRLRRYWKERDAWLPYIDVLKMNLEESLCCWFDMDHNATEGYDENRTDHLDAFAAHVLGQGVKMLYVTLDSRGCALYHTEDGNVKKEFIASVPVTHVVDTTGCGDSFAGGLAFGFAHHNDPIRAAQYANALGAMRTQGKDFSVFKSLEATQEILANTYSTFL